MIYNSSIFGKITLTVIVNYGSIGIQAMGSLGRYGRTVFEIISPIDNFKAIENSITAVARL